MKKIYPLAFYLITIFMNVKATNVASSVRINYQVTFPEALAHYVNVEMTIVGLSQNGVDVKMPVWTPGSYLVR